MRNLCLGSLGLLLAVASSGCKDKPQRVECGEPACSFELHADFEPATPEPGVDKVWANGEEMLVVAFTALARGEMPEGSLRELASMMAAGDEAMEILGGIDSCEDRELDGVPALRCPMRVPVGSASLDELVLFLDMPEHFALIEMTSLTNKQDKLEKLSGQIEKSFRAGAENRSDGDDEQEE